MLKEIKWPIFALLQATVKTLSKYSPMALLKLSHDAAEKIKIG